MKTLIPTVTAPKITNVLFPSLPEGKAARHLVVKTWVAEVNKALNVWAYS